MRLNNSFFRLVILSSIAYIISENSYSQSPSFIHYNINTGLPSNLIYCGLQDRYDILWFGTDKGLIKFNNHKFRVFTTNEGLPDPEVLNLWEDSKANLWISCFKKSPCYRKAEKFITKKEDLRLRDVDFSFGHCNYYEGKNIWLLGKSLVAYELDNKNTIQHNFDDAITNLKLINQHLIAFATTSIINFDNYQPKTIFKFNKSSIGSNSAESIESIGNRVLYSFKDKIILLEIFNDKIKVLDSLFGVTGRISIDKKGRFWVCSPAHGAICFDNPNQDLSNPKIYLPGKKTTYMFEDRQGTYWFCTLDDGIYGLPTNAPITYQKNDGLPSENLISVSRDQRERILFGDDEGNLNILDGQRHSIEKFYAIDGYNRILQILPMGKQGTLLATDEGTFRFFPNGRRELLPFIASSKAVLQDGDYIWCGTSARLARMPIRSNKTDRSYIQRNTAIGKDTDGTLWAGGIEGLYSSRDSFQYNWGEQFPELQNRIIAIQGDSDNILWIATPEAGLLKVFVQDGKVLRMQQANDSLPKPVQNIHSIFREDNGRIWLATNRGIYGISSKDWKMAHYDHHDGLTNDDIRSVHVYRDTLWAATASGLTRMVLIGTESTGDFASLVTGFRFQEDNQINEVFLDNSRRTNRSSTLPVKATLVEVDFAGLDYRSRGNLVFECIMTELLPPLQWLTTDNLLHWIGSGFLGKTDTTRLYKSGLDFGVNMPPGKYQLEVTAVTQNGIRSRHPGVWAIVMPARWYSTFWFSLFIWGLIGLGLYRIYRTRMQLQEMTWAVAQFRLLALQAQINPHFIGNSINALQRFFYPPKPTLASIYNATFTQLLRKTLDFSEYTFIRFDEEVEYNKGYMELARLRYGDDRFEYHITGTDMIPEDLPFPALFLQPILENATIHGSATDETSVVKIAYRLENGYIYCIITDNGPGINSRNAGRKDHIRKSKGNRMLHNKALTLNQLFDIDMQFITRDLSENTPPGKGTQATISFSLKKVIRAQKRQALIDKQTKSLQSNSKYSANKHEKN